MPTLTPRRTAAALAVVALGLSGILSGCARTPGGIAPPPTTASTPTASPDTSRPAPASTPPGSPGPGTSRPAPGTHGSTPTSRPPTNRPAETSTVYAQLVDVWRTGPASYALSYDRVDLLTGKEAAAYYRAHPDKEPQDWAVSNPDSALAQLPVAASGTFYGNQLLGPGNGSDTARITGDQLITRLKMYPRTLVEVTERPSGNHREVVTVTEVYLP